MRRKLLLRKFKKLLVSCTSRHNCLVEKKKEKKKKKEKQKRKKTRHRNLTIFETPWPKISLSIFSGMFGCRHYLSLKCTLAYNLALLICYMSVIYFWPNNSFSSPRYKRNWNLADLAQDSQQRFCYQEHGLVINFTINRHTTNLVSNLVNLRFGKEGNWAITIIANKV